MRIDVRMVLADFIDELEGSLGYYSRVGWVMIIFMVIHYIVVASMEDEQCGIESVDSG